MADWNKTKKKNGKNERGLKKRQKRERMRDKIGPQWNKNQNEKKNKAGIKGATILLIDRRTESKMNGWCLHLVMKRFANDFNVYWPVVEKEIHDARHQCNFCLAGAMATHRSSINTRSRWRCKIVQNLWTKKFNLYIQPTVKPSLLYRNMFYES